MKIEQLTQTKIKEMEHGELCQLLMNYGVKLKDDGADYPKDKLLESALQLKKKADEKQKKIKEESVPQAIAPDVPEEQAKDPIGTLFSMGYDTKEDVLRALQALVSAKRDLEKKEAEINEKAKVISEEEAKLDAKRASVQKQCKQLEQEYKTWQEWHDKVVAAKKKS